MTIIEVAVVVGVLAILTAMGFVFSDSVQLGAKDEQRLSDVESIGFALEDWYLQKTDSVGATYPSTVMINDANYSGVFELGGARLVTPTDTDNRSLYSVSSVGGHAPDLNTYLYEPIRNDGSLCTTAVFNSGTPASDYCVRFNIYYREEATGDVVIYPSVRQQ